MIHGSKLSRVSLDWLHFYRCLGTLVIHKSIYLVQPACRGFPEWLVLPAVTGNTNPPLAEHNSSAGGNPPSKKNCSLCLCALFDLILSECMFFLPDMYGLKILNKNYSTFLKEIARSSNFLSSHLWWKETKLHNLWPALSTWNTNRSSTVGQKSI